jgi:hypothetical protein
MNDMMNNGFVKTAFFMPVAMAITAMCYMLSGVEGNTWNTAVLNNLLALSVGLLILAFILAIRAKSKPARNACYWLLAVTILGFLWVTLLSFPGTGGRLGNQGAEVFVYSAFASCAVIAWITRSAVLYFIGAIIVAIPIAVATIYLMVTNPLTSALKDMDLSKTCVVQMEFDQNGRMINPHRVLNPNDYKLGWRISEGTPRIIVYSDTGIKFWSFTIGDFDHRDYSNHPPKTCPAG